MSPIRVTSGSAAGVDVLDQNGPLGGPVAFPELDALAPIRSEEHGAISIRQASGRCIKWDDIRVRDQDGARWRADALPQAIVGSEEEGAVDIRQIAEAPGFEPHRAFGGAIAGP